MGNGADPFTFAYRLGGMHEDDAQIHSCEIIFGLQCPHSMYIVHIDLKLKKVLLSHLIHFLITGLVRHMMSEKKRHPESRKFYIPLHYMVFDKGNEIEIATKVGV